MHNLETVVYIRQFDHGGVVEEEVVGQEVLIAKDDESFAVNVKDLYGHAAWVRFGVRWRKRGSLA